MRISGGSFKNTKLDSLTIEGVRPTSEKMRQAIFNLLAHSNWGVPLSGLRVLDGFCGSGIMGLEALSRGAAHVGFCDMSKPVLRALQTQIKNLAQRSTSFAERINAQDTLRFVQADLTKVTDVNNAKPLKAASTHASIPSLTATPTASGATLYDLAFFDPPYHKEFMPAVLKMIHDHAALMRDQSLVLFETEKEFSMNAEDQAALASAFTLLDQRDYGIGRLWVWRYTKIPA